MNSRATLLIATLLATGINVAAAKEGPDQYPHGAESFMAGALPPPGSYFLNYAGYYGGRLQSPTGQDVLPGGEPVEVDAWFDALRFVHVTDAEVLGASVAMQAIVPIVHQTMSIGPMGGARTVTGLGDISINPFILGWHRQNLHITAGIDIYLPTGRYDELDPRGQIGANYYSVEPVIAFTYRNPSGFEASAKLMYNIKGKNRDTDVRSGDEFHADFLIGWHRESWSYGLSGYYVNQVNEDRVNGQDLALSEGHAFALGPSVQFADAKGRTFTFQAQHEMDVENRFEGNKFWFKYVTRF